jgi:hypothetical protein
MSLISWNTCLLQKLMVAEWLYYGTRRFITVFTKDRQFGLMMKHQNPIHTLWSCRLWASLISKLFSPTFSECCLVVYSLPRWTAQSKFPNLGVRRKRIGQLQVVFRLRTGMEVLCPLYGRLGGPQNRSGLEKEERSSPAEDLTAVLKKIFIFNIIFLSTWRSVMKLCRELLPHVGARKLRNKARCPSEL